MQAIRGFWARSELNKITLLMSFSLVFCCCGWTGRIGGETPRLAAGEVAPRAIVSEGPGHRMPNW